MERSRKLNTSYPRAEKLWELLQSYRVKPIINRIRES